MRRITLLEIAVALSALALLAAGANWLAGVYLDTHWFCRGCAL